MSIWGAITGSDAADAANAAAADTYSKQQRAIADLLNYGDQYAGAFKDLSQAYNPYVSGGNAALTRLLSGLGLDGGNGGDFAAAYRNLPGYQYGLQTGSQAVTGNAAAKGMLNSGATLKGLQRFGSNYEDQRAGDYLTRLTGMAGMGQTATGQQVATQAQGLQGQLGTRTTGYGGQMNAAGTVGQGMIAGANAEAQGMQNLLNFGGTMLGKVFSLGGGAGGLSGLSGLGRTSGYATNPG